VLANGSLEGLHFLGGAWWDRIFDAVVLADKTAEGKVEVLGPACLANIGFWCLWLYLCQLVELNQDLIAFTCAN
jgi:hypothetical protein